MQLLIRWKAAAALAATMAMLGAASSRAEVTPMPLVPGDKESDSVKISVDGKPVPVGVWSVGGVGYCHFDTDKPVTVTISTDRPGGKDLQLATNDRSRYAATPAEGGKSWQITMKPDSKVYLKGSRTFICASSPDKQAPAATDPAVVTISSFGVKPGAATSATKGIQAAIDKAAASGRKVVFVPAGVYICGTLFMRDNVTLYLAPGAVLRGSEQAAEWQHKPGALYLGYSAFIFFGQKTDKPGEFIGVKNAAIRGRGTIDGWGHFFRGRGNNPYFYDDDTTQRARLIMALKAENCRVEGVTLRDPVFWTTDIVGSKAFDFTDVKIYANHRINNDGIDYDSCTDSTVDNCVMITGDDSQCLKNEYPDGLGGPNERIRVANSIMTGFGIGVKFGWAFHKAHDVTYDNNVLVSTSFSMAIGVKPIRAAGPKIAEMTNIVLNDMVVDGDLMVRVGTKIDGYTLRGITITNTSVNSLSLRKADGVTLRGLTIAGKAINSAADLPADAVVECTNVTVTPR